MIQTSRPWTTFASIREQNKRARAIDLAFETANRNLNRIMPINGHKRWSAVEARVRRKGADLAALVENSRAANRRQMAWALETFSFDACADAADRLATRGSDVALNVRKFRGDIALKECFTPVKFAREVATCERRVKLRIRVIARSHSALRNAT
jgi:hypothetical protein